MVSLRNWA